jgi:hypothetical protein
MTLTLKEFEDIPQSVRTGLTVWLRQLDYENPKTVPEDIKAECTWWWQVGDDVYVSRYENL